MFQQFCRSIRDKMTEGDAFTYFLTGSYIPVSQMNAALLLAA